MVEMAWTSHTHGVCFYDLTQQHMSERVLLLNKGVFGG